MRTDLMFRTLAIAAAMAVATSCGDSKKDDPAPVPETENPEPEPEPEEKKLPAPSTAGLKKLRDDALDTLKTTTKETFTLGGITFETKKKVNGNIDFHHFTKQDSTSIAIDSEVEFSVAEIYDRGTMAVANMPLMGQKDGKLEPLATGGLLFFGAKQEGEDLVYGGDVNVYFKLQGLDPSFSGGNPGDSSAYMWRGVTDVASGNLSWTTTPLDGYGRVGEVMCSGGEYQSLETNMIGWLNVGWFYLHQGTKTKIKVSVPDNYDNKNAAVYLAYEGVPNLLAQLYDYEATGRSFSETVGFVPVGKNVHVIFISESEGKFVYAIKTVTVKADDAIAFEHKDLATIEQTADLVKKINDLK